MHAFIWLGKVNIVSNLNDQTGELPAHRQRAIDDVNAVQAMIIGYTSDSLATAKYV